MNKRKLFGLLIIPLLLGTLSGCSIVRNSKNAETEKLKTDDSFEIYKNLQVWRKNMNAPGSN